MKKLSGSIGCMLLQDPSMSASCLLVIAPFAGASGPNMGKIEISKRPIVHSEMAKHGGIDHLSPDPKPEFVCTLFAGHRPCRGNS